MLNNIGTIGGVSRNEFLSVAEIVFSRLQALPENPAPERTGGYLYVYDGQRERPLLLVEIGECLSDMVNGCFQYAQEKATRVWQFYPANVSSAQSRDPDVKKYSGAILPPPNSKGLQSGRFLVGSFSGHKEIADEAIVIVQWMIFRWIVLEDAHQIASYSGNTLWEPLMNACTDLFDIPVLPGPLADRVERYRGKA